MPDSPKPPPQKPIVRHGDVLAVMGKELLEWAQVIQRAHAFEQRLAVYAELHPDRHAHLARFLGGEDDPTVVDEAARAHEAESRQADADAQTPAG